MRIAVAFLGDRSHHEVRAVADVGVSPHEDGAQADPDQHLVEDDDLAQVSRKSGELAQRMVYCLRKVGLIDLVGKRGRANLYGLAPAGRGNT